MLTLSYMLVYKAVVSDLILRIFVFENHQAQRIYSHLRLSDKHIYLSPEF